MSEKNPAAVSLGKLGGKASAEALTKDQKLARARKAGQARWANRSPDERSEHARKMRAVQLKG